ncbi:hypothetical protein D3C84_706770 [compost metagenome]
MVIRGSEPGLRCRTPQPLDKALLLARAVAAEQCIDTAVPAGDLPVELAGGQIPVVPQIKRPVPDSTMPDHQQVEPIEFPAGLGDRRQVIERQDLPMLDHQDFDPWIVIEKQGTVAAVDVLQGRGAVAVQAQGGDA